MRVDITDYMFIRAVLFDMFDCVHQIISCKFKCAPGADSILDIEIVHMDSVFPGNCVLRNIADENAATLMQWITMDHLVNFCDS